MPVHLQQLTVAYEYPVYFETDVFAPGNPALVEALSRKELGRRHRTAFVVERRVAELWPRLLEDIGGYVRAHAARIELAGAPLVVEGTERSKNDPNAVERLQARFDAYGLDRQAAVVIVGGGALQDMAGYAAATTHRGVRVVRVPTTVLSQNDSGVGVKNGINRFGKKNFLGTFAPPFAVLDDFRFLETLEPRDKVAGMAEAVKVALIKDRGFFDWLAENAARLTAFEPEAMASMIRRCAVLHLEHIATSGDPFELGSSRPLDFGHWAAHKLEVLSGYTLRHGEAVAIGIALDSRYSAEVGLLPEDRAERIVDLLERLGLPTWHGAADIRSGGVRRLFEGIEEFREHLGGDLTVMMLEDLGSGREVHHLDERAVERSLDWLRERARRAAPLAAGVPARESLCWGPK